MTDEEGTPADRYAAAVARVCQRIREGWNVKEEEITGRQLIRAYQLYRQGGSGTWDCLLIMERNEEYMYFLFGVIDYCKLRPEARSMFIRFLEKKGKAEEDMPDVMARLPIIALNAGAGFAEAADAVGRLVLFWDETAERRTEFGEMLDDGWVSGAIAHVLARRNEDLQDESSQKRRHLMVPTPEQRVGVAEKQKVKGG